MKKRHLFLATKRSEFERNASQFLYCLWFCFVLDALAFWSVSAVAVICARGTQWLRISDTKKQTFPFPSLLQEKWKLGGTKASQKGKKRCCGHTMSGTSKNPSIETVTKIQLNQSNFLASTCKWVLSDSEKYLTKVNNVLIVFARTCQNIPFRF